MSGSIKDFYGILMGQANDEHTVKVSDITISDYAAIATRLAEELEVLDLENIRLALNTHLDNTTNPHEVSTVQLFETASRELYETWLAFGGRGSYDFFLPNLFRLFTLASESDMDEGTSEAIFSTENTNIYYLNKHNNDATAHIEEIQAMFPGTPPATSPVFSFNAEVGNSIRNNVKILNDTNLSYVDQFGTIHSITEDDDYVVDYSLDRPTFMEHHGDTVFTSLYNFDMRNHEEVYPTINTTYSDGDGVDKYGNAFVGLINNAVTSTHGIILAEGLTLDTYTTVTFQVKKGNNDQINIYFGSILTHTVNLNDGSVTFEDTISFIHVDNYTDAIEVTVTGMILTGDSNTDMYILCQNIDGSENYLGDGEIGINIGTPLGYEGTQKINMIEVDSSSATHQNNSIQLNLNNTILVEGYTYHVRLPIFNATGGYFLTMYNDTDLTQIALRLGISKSGSRDFSIYAMVRNDGDSSDQYEYSHIVENDENVKWCHVTFGVYDGALYIKLNDTPTKVELFDGTACDINTIVIGKSGGHTNLVRINKILVYPEPFTEELSAYLNNND